VSDTDALRFRVNMPSIAHEVVDGEVVIINLVTGDYYSCRGVAADAWQALSAGATVTEVAVALSSAYEVGDADVAADVAEFVRASTADGLLVEHDGDAAPVPPFGTGAYEVPAFEKFSDMADLIVLDPVHDVTGEGWPHATGSA